jgi:hypothetical protein
MYETNLRSTTIKPLVVVAVIHSYYYFYSRTFPIIFSTLNKYFHFIRSLQITWTPCMSEKNTLKDFDDIWLRSVLLANLFCGSAHLIHSIL